MNFYFIRRSVIRCVSEPFGGRYARYLVGGDRKNVDVIRAELKAFGYGTSIASHSQQCPITY